MKKTHYSGFPDDCSPEQLEALAEFRTYVRGMGLNDPPYDDVYLLRFLRARKFDMKKTIIMWNNFIQFRKDEKADELLNYDYPELDEVKKHYPHAYFKTDKIGRPVFYERAGMLNYHELMKVTTMERFQKYFIKEYEELLTDVLPGCSKALGKRVDQTVYIMDLKGGALKLLAGKTSDFVKGLMKIGQDNYPEILGRMFIINAPMIFYGIWALFKNFVDEKTRNKINILGSSYQKELLEVIDEENLPDFLGGKATVDEYGPNFTNNTGPWVPYQESRKWEYAKQKELANKIPVAIETTKHQEHPHPIEHNTTEDAEKDKKIGDNSLRVITEETVTVDDFDLDELWDMPKIKKDNTKVHPIFQSRFKLISYIKSSSFA